jgi:hypothetical protein
MATDSDSNHHHHNHHCMLPCWPQLTILSLLVHLSDSNQLWFWGGWLTGLHENFYAVGECFGCLCMSTAVQLETK